MKSNSQIRQESLKAIRGSWFTLALITLVSSIIAAGPSLPTVIQTLTHPLSMNYLMQAGEYSAFSSAGPLVNFLIVVPITYSIYLASMRLIRGEKDRIRFGDMFCAFGNGRYIKIIVLQFLITIFTFLWSLLLIIPGIIKSLSYSMAPFILLDNPETGLMDAIDSSCEMMKGHKGSLFLIYLGMIGFIILGAFTLGIAYFWIIPYYLVVLTDFYENLKKDMVPQSYLQPED